MGRIARAVATGKFIEYQSHARPGTLTQNAVNAGWAAADVVEEEITAADWRAVRASLDAAVFTPQAIDQRVEAEDDVWLAALLTHLPAMLDEHAATGKLNVGLWRYRLRAAVKLHRRPRG